MILIIYKVPNFLSGLDTIDSPQEFVEDPSGKQASWFEIFRPNLVSPDFSLSQDKL